MKDNIKNDKKSTSLPNANKVKNNNEDEIIKIAKRILQEHKKAFEELAK